MTELSNYELFLQTVNSLKHSQGFYSRIANQLAEMDEESREQLKDELNSKEKWHDSLDVVYWLEQ